MPRRNDTELPWKLRAGASATRAPERARPGTSRRKRLGHDSSGRFLGPFERRPVAWLALVAGIAASAVVRLRLLEIPLERDEGDYAYIAQLLLQGIPPYGEAYEMRMPGIFAAYALILAAFGHTPAAIHLGLLIVNAATSVVLFLLGRRLFDGATGAGAAVAFSALSLSPAVLGTSANTEHFVLLPALVGARVLIDARRRPLFLLASGLAFGVAALMKQPGACFALFGASVLLAELWRARLLRSAAGWAALGWFGAGAVLPFAATAVALWWAGTFSEFWFWTIEYPLEYAGAFGHAGAWLRLEQRLGGLFASAPGSWLLVGVGAVSLLPRTPSPRQSAPSERAWLLGFTLVSLLAIAPGLRFRPQHFVLLLPALCLLAGRGVSAIGTWLARFGSTRLAGAAQLAVLALGLTLYARHERRFLLQMGPLEASRALYGLNPFPESLEIARYLAEHTGPDDRIAVLGSEPQIYFYARRRSATPFLLTYELMRGHEHAKGMQQEMIRELEQAEPAYLVYVNVDASWLPGTDSERLLLDWYLEHVEERYTQVGLIEIDSILSRFTWGEAAARRAPAVREWVAVWRRKDAVDADR